MLNHISYLDNEIADNNANYFLVEMKDPLQELKWKNSSEIAIKKVGDGQTFFEFIKSDNNDTNYFDSLFYCFDTTTVLKIEELNFNNLKKCESQPIKHKFLVIATSNELKSSDVSTPFNKTFDEWHKSKPDIYFQVQNGSTFYHYAKVLKIFHKEYQPTT